MVCCNNCITGYISVTEAEDQIVQLMRQFVGLIPDGSKAEDACTKLVSPVREGIHCLLHITAPGTAVHNLIAEGESIAGRKRRNGDLHANIVITLPNVIEPYGLGRH